MQMSGSQRINASRVDVWEALNDPAVLKQCIPGCQSLEVIDEDRMRATAAVKIGPIGAKFNGEVSFSDRDPPNGYRIEGEGQGGAAGFAKGGAGVRLTSIDAGTTQLDYEVDAQVGGKLAQLGGALIDITAKQMAGQFFKKFAAEVAKRHVADVPAPAEDVAASTSAPDAAPSMLPTEARALQASPVASAGSSIAVVAWGLAVLCGALLGFILGRQANGWDAAGGWPGLAIGLAMVVVAGAAFALGRSAR